MSITKNATFYCCMLAIGSLSISCSSSSQNKEIETPQVTQENNKENTILNNLNIPIVDGWKVTSEANLPNSFLSVSLINEDELVEINSEKTNPQSGVISEYITTENNKIIRSMEFKNFSLLTSNDQEIKFNNVPAYQSTLVFKNKETGNNTTKIAVYFDYSDWQYSIAYSDIAVSLSLVQKISFLEFKGFLFWRSQRLR